MFNRTVISGLGAGTGSAARTVSVPAFQIVQPSGTINIAAQSITLPDIPPQSNTQNALVVTNSGASLDFQYIQGAPAAWNATTGAMIAWGVDLWLEPFSGTIRKMNPSSPDISLNITYTGVKSRYDVTWVNPVTGSVGVALGTPRQRDPDEFMPKAPDGTIPLYSLLLWNGANVDYASLFDWNGYCKIGEEARFERQMRFNRSCMPRTMKKLINGDPVLIAVVGDSQVACGANFNLDINTDGDNFGFYGRYPADVASHFHPVAGPGYTIAEDNFTHVMKRELVARYGSTITLANFGINGAADGFASPNANFPARLANIQAKNADLVILADGSNELGGLTIASDICAFIDSMRATGADVMIIGCPYFNSYLPAQGLAPYTQSASDAVVEMQIRAALSRGAAFVSTYELFGSGREGSTGMFGRTRGGADGFHMGRMERFHIGKFASLSF